MSISPLAIDIETVGVNWEDLDAKVRDYLIHRGKPERTEEETKRRLALNPGTGRIIAIGMWRPVEDKGGVLLECQGSDDCDSEWRELNDDSMIYRGEEPEILTEFWRYVSSGVGRLITFNGRSFDGPFLTLRSALLGINPTRSFSPYRYSFRKHCDLAEVISFHGARGMETLDFWCRRAGISSPKNEMDGSMVGQAYKAGKIKEIGEYCLRDARATAKLFQVLKPVIEVLEREN